MFYNTLNVTRSTNFMTEDDTYRFLTRPTKMEMTQILNTDFHSGGSYLLEYNEYIAQKEIFLREHGWTIYEYNKI